MAKMKKDIYLIHPLRNITDFQKAFLDGYVSGVESEGRKVHYPIRDVDQNDPTGLRILSEHRHVIEQEISEARIYFDKTSTGSMFDLGMIFMADVPLKVINQNDMNGTENCVADFIKHYTGNIPVTKMSDNYCKILQRREILEQDLVEIKYTWEKSPEKLFDLGMVFMRRIPIRLTNHLERTPHKSFENVLLELDSMD